MNANKSKMGIVSLALLAALLASENLQAQAEKLSLAGHLSNLKISGDLRIRQENFWWSTTHPPTDRSRQRFRFRLGIMPQIQDFTIGFRLASGTGEQTSTNQTFEDLSSGKHIWIDQVYLQWKALEWLKITGGKMPNPFWRIYASDLVWDEDLNPEGFAQQMEYKVHDKVRAFANFSQLVLEERGTEPRQQWLLGFQAGAETILYKQNKWNSAITYYSVTNARAGTFGQRARQHGNTRFPGTASSTVSANFTMLHFTNELRTNFLGKLVSLQFDYVQNIADNPDNLTQGTQVIGSSGTEKTGIQAGIIFGRAATAKEWEIAYFYKWVQTNATLADLADSDFGEGGTNRRGHIVWIAFNPRDYIQVRAKLFVTETLREDLAPGLRHINRGQLDIAIRF